MVVQLRRNRRWRRSISQRIWFVRLIFGVNADNRTTSKSKIKDGVGAQVNMSPLQPLIRQIIWITGWKTVKKWSSLFPFIRQFAVLLLCVNIYTDANWWKLKQVNNSTYLITNYIIIITLGLFLKKAYTYTFSSDRVGMLYFLLQKRTTTFVQRGHQNHHRINYKMFFLGTLTENCQDASG